MAAEPTKPIPFLGDAYEAISKPISAQQSINLYPEQPNSAARSNLALIRTPGLTEFVDVGAGPIRGLHTFLDKLYAVSGEELYQIDSSGTSTLLGAVLGSTRVSIANNTTQVCIVNGTQGYIFTPSSNLFQQIVDPDFRQAEIVQFLDQYFIFNEKDTGRFFISALADGTSYDPLDFGTAEGSPDNIVSILADHRDLLLFGETSIELWDNTGDVDFPFAPQNGVFIERGCSATFSTLKMDNQVYWLGEDRVVYVMEGYTPRRISTHAIEEQIRGYSRVDDAFAFTYTEDGHYFYILTFPTGGETWVYDAATKLWHQRSTGTLGEEWRANAYAKFNRKNYIGDQNTGQIFEMSLDVYDEDGDEIRRIRTTMPLTAGERTVFMSKIQVYLDSGQGLISGQGSDPLIGLSWSDDGGRTFNSPRFRSVGKIGEYEQRVIWRRLGLYRNRVYKLEMTDPIAWAIIDASAEVEAGF